MKIINGETRKRKKWAFNFSFLKIIICFNCFLYEYFICKNDSLLLIMLTTFSKFNFNFVDFNYARIFKINT